MTWEYRTEPISFNDIDETNAGFNSMGRDGWELVAVVPNATGKDQTWPVAIFKRHVTEPPKSN
jgi:hypothetical protein